MSTAAQPTGALGDVVVLAGGLGTRLRSEVPDLPKPLAPVAGRPFLAWLLDRLLTAGASRVVLAEGYRAEAFRAQLGDDFHGLPLVHVIEPEALGTGGAILHAMRSADCDSALVLNGDTLVTIDHAAFAAHCRALQAPLGLAVRPVADVGRYGRCDVHDGWLTAFSEKGHSGPGLINAGVYQVQRALLEGLALPRRCSFEADVVPRVLASGRIPAVQVAGYFIDIGVPEDYRRAQSELPALGA